MLALSLLHKYLAQHHRNYYDKFQWADVWWNGPG